MRNSNRLDTLKAFFNHGKQLHFLKGQVIIKDQNLSEDVFYIDSGFVVVYKNEPKALSFGNEGSSQKKIYSIYKPDEIFPLQSVFNNVDKKITFKALGEVCVYKVLKADFIKFVSQSPQVALEVINKLSSLANVYFERIDHLEFTKTHSRVIARLLFFADRFGEKSGKKVRIALPVTHADIANSLGMSRETTTRVLSSLEKTGLISYQNKLIILNDQDKLNTQLISDKPINRRGYYLESFFFLVPVLTDLLSSIS